MLHVNLHECMEYLEDLFLDEDREHRGVRQQLGDELLDPGQEELHSSQQGHPLLRFLKPVNNNHIRQLQPLITHTLSHNTPLV